MPRGYDPLRSPRVFPDQDVRLELAAERGADDRGVRKWLATAAGVPGFIGFAVGRTVFWDPLVDWRAKKTTREATVGEISRRYREFVDIFENAARPASTRTDV